MERYLRILDIIISIVLLVATLPALIFIAILVKLYDFGPVLHISKRVGKENRLFLMPKFRTMKLETPQVATHLLASESFVTPIGKFLRKTSLDELPQLFSVIKGDMALVGPRPALFNQYDLVEMRTGVNVHLLRPGVTGWAQINGRDNISLEKKVELDQYYFENRTIFFDLVIILKTVRRVLLADNISH